MTIIIPMLVGVLVMVGVINLCALVWIWLSSQKRDMAHREELGAQLKMLEAHVDGARMHSVEITKLKDRVSKVAMQAGLIEP